ncbi:hypothetical protein ACXXDK_18190 (plasmid) [Deinococcus sp. PESE-38]
MTTSLTSPRIALLSPQAHYTIPELRERWRVAAHIAHREIHHALLAGELFLTACEPLTYSRTPQQRHPNFLRSGRNTSAPSRPEPATTGCCCTTTCWRCGPATPSAESA